MSNPLLEQFINESADLLADVDSGLLRLEADPEDAEIVNAVFRAAHTFKGSSGLFDLPELTRLTHAAEDLLDQVRSGQLALTTEMVDALLQAFDTVRRWMPTIEATGRTPDDAAAVTAFRAGVLRSFTGAEPEPVAASASGTTTATATVSGTAAAPADLPGWVADLPSEHLAQLRTWLETTSSTVRAVRYEPDAGCYFRGDDPLSLFRQVPALELLHVAPEEPFAPMAELDEYECLLRFTALTRAAAGELAHVFRYVPDQVEVVEVGALGLGRLIDGVPAGPLNDSAIDGAASTGASDAPAESDALLGQLMVWQDRLLEREGVSEAAVRSALLVLDLVGEADTSGGARAAAAAVPTGGAPGASHPATAAVPAPRASAEAASAAPAGASSGATTGPVTEAPATSGDDVPRTRILKIDQAKVDKLLDLVGELAVAKNALPFVAAEAETAGSRGLARRVMDEYAVVSRVSEELQAAVMEVRMLPVSTAFARVPRLVRDLSHKLGKKVRLVQEGEDTAADKDVIEQLAEPLVHLVRNSLDHGIETPESRLAAGKPEEAILTLRAAPDGDSVVIEIEDDGRGIDTAVVRRKAYERGLIDESALETMSDEDAAALIFAPGFSTAAVVSDVSGRGVGMDAVRAFIEGLGGSVVTVNRPGEGLLVRLRLPLTMAVSRVLLLTTGAQRFGVPLDDVVETVRVDRHEVTRVAGYPALALRDTVVPLVRLDELLGATPRALDKLSALGDQTTDAPLNVLVVRTATGPLGLVVDTFHQNTDVILKPLEGLLAGTPGYCGTALLGDGLVLLVLDVKELNSRAADHR
ncbi:two-component system, chemotaxis family, sensor kinase CheA [Quadrisphaera granulorum]|uniref:histidine kinase n=1 Tax=Quadrisphaera granulorum TaxID=317664 RepID=A0A316AD59_9ACTN|nr:chemotaxis protein CheA [Quadrisphaera granulorum]PWJ55695.1 two-component system chemotaxis sensor kinase CheA [Quadrisphaera granulorum]SZE95192.1 two-component system, chemotaxis family, sensor kinase CheA [Quadrisphaera granulorum]